MENFQSILQTKIYRTEDKKTVFIKDNDFHDLIKKYGEIKNIPDEVTISAFLLELETYPIDSIVYRMSNQIEINCLAKLIEDYVRCSDFSEFRN